MVYIGRMIYESIYRELRNLGTHSNVPLFYIYEGLQRVTKSYEFMQDSHFSGWLVIHGQEST